MSSFTLPEQCGRYRELPNVYGYCLTRVAMLGRGEQGGAEWSELHRSAEEVCGDAGEWERDCRHAWATSRAHLGATDRYGNPLHTRVPDEVLFEACQDNGDCRFAILDARPSEDVVVQLDRCAEHAGEYDLDCTLHALDRWVRTFPSEEEAKLVSQVEHHPGEVGRYLAILVNCHGVGQCTGSEQAMASCEDAHNDIDATFCETYTVPDPEALNGRPPGLFAGGVPGQGAQQPTLAPLPEGDQRPREPGSAPPGEEEASSPPTPPTENGRPVPTGPPGDSPTGG